MPALLLLACLFALCPAAAATEWVQVTADPVAGRARCLLPDAAHERLILGTEDGFRVYYPLTDEWLVREGPYTSLTTSLLAHPTDPVFLLAGYYGGFFNGWIEDHSGLVAEGPLVLDIGTGAITGMARLPSQPEMLFATALNGESAGGGVFGSIDGGQNWTSIHDVYPSEANALAVTPDGDLLVGLSGGVMIARGVDGGQSWIDATGDMPSDGNNRIDQIVVDPATSQHIYAVQAPGVPWDWDDFMYWGIYETTDGGAHWERIFQGDVSALCMDPTSGDALVAVFNAGFALTRNGGDTWVDISDGLPAAARACAILPTDDRIHVGTLEDGLWATAASPSAVGEAPAAGLDLAAHPNPFNPSTTLAFDLREACAVSLDILDAQGRRLRRLLAEAPLPAGWQRAIWDGRDDSGGALPSGVYFARLTAPEGVASGKLLMLK